MDTALKKESKLINVEKIVVELESGEVRALVDLLHDAKSFPSLGDAYAGFIDDLLVALENPKEVINVPVRATVAGDKPVPDKIIDDLDPSDPQFKSKVIDRLFKTNPVNGVGTIDGWKKAGVDLMKKVRKGNVASPKSFNDSDYFDWLVVVGVIGENGKRDG